MEENGMSLSEQLSAARKAKGDTQAAAADAIGAKQNQISAWENGKVDIPDDYVKAVKAYCEGSESEEPTPAPSAVEPAKHRPKYRDGVYSLELKRTAPMTSYPVAITTLFDPARGRERDFSVTLEKKAQVRWELACPTCDERWVPEPPMRPGAMKKLDSEFKWHNRYAKSHECPKCAKEGKTVQGLRNIIDPDSGPRGVQHRHIMWLTAAERQRIDDVLSPDRKAEPIYQKVKQPDGTEAQRQIHQGIGVLAYKADPKKAPVPVHEYVRIEYLGNNVDSVLANLIPGVIGDGEALERQQTLEAIDSEMARLSDVIADPDSTNGERQDAAEEFRRLRSERTKYMAAAVGGAA